MRYFITGFLALCALFVSFAGFQGNHSRNTPLELFPDMDRQPKVRPQTPSLFFKKFGEQDGRGSLLPPEHTVARSQGVEVENAVVLPFEDHPINTGRQANSEEWVMVNPLKVDLSLVSRGRERFNIYCTPCHGAAGDGIGIVTEYNFTTADLHQNRLVQLPDGYLFDVVSNGFNQATNAQQVVAWRMPAYRSKLSVKDRWAVVAYLRALQMGQLDVAQVKTDPEDAGN